MTDGAALVDETHRLGRAHEAMFPVWGHDADHVQHLRGEMGERTVFDQEGDFAVVEGGRRRIADGDCREGGQRW